MTNLFAIAGHFVSYRWVSGPHNFLVILWNLLKTKKLFINRSGSKKVQDCWSRLNASRAARNSFAGPMFVTSGLMQVFDLAAQCRFLYDGSAGVVVTSTLHALWPVEIVANWIYFSWKLKQVADSAVAPNVKLASHGRPQKFFQGGGNIEILLIFYWLLTMQCKWTFTKRFTLSTPLVCTGWTSILNLLSEMFFTLRLSEMVFPFINCQISIFSSTFYK